MKFTPTPAPPEVAAELAKRHPYTDYRWAEKTDGRFWLMYADDDADDADARRAAHRIGTAARTWAKRNGQIAQVRRADNGRRVWVRFEPKGDPS